MTALAEFFGLLKLSQDVNENTMLPFPLKELRSVAAEIEVMQMQLDHADQETKPLVQEPLVINYRNWRGEVSCRTIHPIGIWYGTSEWHKMPQWFLKAFDVDKQEQRDFAIADFRGDSLPA